jgi:hypothetical protein
VTDSVCEVGEPYRSACQGQTHYAEHEGKRYCVLHYPNKDKADDADKAFQFAVSEKLQVKDFNFAGVYFPEHLDDFASIVFDTEADFSNASFVDGATLIPQ